MICKNSFSEGKLCSRGVVQRVLARQQWGSSLALHPTAQVWHLPSPPTCSHTTSTHSSLESPWGQANHRGTSNGYLLMCRNATLPCWLCANALFSLPSKSTSSMDWSLLPLVDLKQRIEFQSKNVSFRLDFAIVLYYHNCSCVPQDFMCLTWKADSTSEVIWNWHVFKHFDITGKMFPRATG